MNWSRLVETNKERKNLVSAVHASLSTSESIPVHFPKKYISLPLIPAKKNLIFSQWYCYYMHASGTKR